MSKPINHIAFILDGNRRWATEQGMNKIDGHQHGFENVHTILRHCKELGVSNVSLYALSTENWNRSQREIDALLSLFRKFIITEKDKLLEHGTRVRFVGDLSRFDDDLQQQMREIEETTAYITERTVFICLSYGGRLEITRAAEAMAQTGDEYTEENFEKHLWSHDMPDVDLMIRTGGNHRLSNFLLWRCAYAELYFTDTRWPAFTAGELDQIVADYHETIQVNKGK